MGCRIVLSEASNHILRALEVSGLGESLPPIESSRSTEHRSKQKYTRQDRCGSCQDL